MARKKIPPTDMKGMEVFRFLKTSYDEALLLLVLSRDYFAIQGRKDKQKLSKDQQLIYTLASSTITTQLTSVMSWLLLCRAMQEGELTLEQLQEEKFAMPEINPGVTESDSCFSTLSAPVKELLAKSSNLYNRMKRMESSVREHFMYMV